MACGEDRPEEAPAPAAEAKGWHCTAGTFENGALDSACAMCETRRPGAAAAPAIENGKEEADEPVARAPRAPSPPKQAPAAAPREVFELPEDDPLPGAEFLGPPQVVDITLSDDEAAAAPASAAPLKRAATTVIAHEPARAARRALDPDQAVHVDLVDDDDGDSGDTAWKQRMAELLGERPPRRGSPQPVAVAPAARARPAPNPADVLVDLADMSDSDAGHGPAVAAGPAAAAKPKPKRKPAGNAEGPRRCALVCPPARAG
jgi:hypothetical protein